MSFGDVLGLMGLVWIGLLALALVCEWLAKKLRKSQGVDE
jgi:hypothetical protein